MITTASIALQRHPCGVDLVTLRNEQVAIVVAPELGAKVVSLTNLRSGRDWLSDGSPAALVRNKLGDNFASSTLSGWDECLPTISACTWNGRELPDHGEVWSVPWVADTSQPTRVRTTVDLPLSPLRFSRELSLQENEITATYTLTSLAEVPQLFLWAMHPLIVPRAGDRVVLPQDALSQLSDSAWLNNLDLSGRFPAYAKVFIARLPEGRAAVVNDNTGDRLSFEWNALENNTLGIWLTRGGWNGCHHLALEPTNAAADSLADAATQNHCGVIDANETKTWTIRMRIES
jgi:galactose mutarotase-like enzyme